MDRLKGMTLLLAGLVAASILAVTGTQAYTGLGAQSASASTSLNTGLVTYWKFDDSLTSNSVNDSSGHRNLGTLSFGTSETNQNCAVGTGCLHADGADDYVSGPEQSMRLPGPWTISAWVKVDETGVVNPILTKMGSSNGHENYEMHVDANNHLVCRAHNTTGADFETSSGQISAGMWYNLVCRYDGSTITGWVNGTNTGSVAFTGHPCTACVIGTPRPFTVATMGPNSGCPGCTTLNLAGSVDDVRVYNRALSSAEILQLSQSK